MSFNLPKPYIPISKPFVPTSKSLVPISKPTIPSKIPQGIKPKILFKKPIRKLAKSIGRGIGKGAKVFGSGVFDLGAGFVEGLDREKISARGVGRGIGKIVQDRPKITFREDYWTVKKTKKPVSRLPVEIQSSIVKYLSELYPEIYMHIWHENIEYPEFVGTVRDNFPDVYTEIREHIQYEEYRQRTYRQPSYTPSYSPQSYPYDSGPHEGFHERYI